MGRRSRPAGRNAAEVYPDSSTEVHPAPNQAPTSHMVMPMTSPPPSPDTFDVIVLGAGAGCKQVVPMGAAEDGR
jgi:hypothetical protein